MEHSRETTSAAFKVEPADGTKLVIQKSGSYGEPEWEVIWRDDAEANRRWDNDPRGQHWFRASDEDSMELHQYLKYADAVYNVGSLIVDFGESDDEDGDDE